MTRLSEELTKYPDEDEIEKVLDAIYDVAWGNVILPHDDETKLFEDIRWVLNVWDKNYMGNKRLSQMIENHYLSKLLSVSDKKALYKELDLVICFFQHYIYAFEEFMNRGFRDCVIRCGLICERFVKRLAIAANHPEVLGIKNFEDRANKLTSLLENKCDEIQFLVNRMKDMYSKRSQKAAHDTGAAGMLISKSCVSQIPIAYMEYLDSLEKLDYKFLCKDELLSLINSTVSIGTTLIVTKAGEPTKPESVLMAMYRHNYFVKERTFADVEDTCKANHFTFPKTTLWKALNDLCEGKILTKPNRNCYVQRTPPEEYFKKELVE